MKTENSPIIDQFLVLGILNVSYSFSHPQYNPKFASQIRYNKYELVVPPASAPRPSISFDLSPIWMTDGTGPLLDATPRSNLESKAQAQHGMER